MRDELVSSFHQREPIRAELTQFLDPIPRKRIILVIRRSILVIRNEPMRND